MAVETSVNFCCWVALDSEIRALFLAQVTVVAGPPEEMQVRVLEAKLCVIDVLIVS